MAANEKTMGRFVKRFLFFGILFAFSYLLLVFLAANVEDRIQVYFRKYTSLPVGIARRGDSSLLRFREIGEYRDVDVIFVGSSHCYRAFDPRFFARHNLRSFNMGSTMQTPINAYFLLKQHIDRLNPALVIMEVYWEVLGSNGLESFLDLVENVPLTAETWRMACATGDLRSINALLVRLFEWQREPLELMPPDLRQLDTYIPGGYVEKGLSFEGLWGISPHRIDVNPQQVEYLEGVLSMVKKRGISVVLVVQPLPTETLATITNLEEVQEVLRLVAERNGVVQIDFNGLMKLESEKDFFDRDHLNRFGVEKFNQKLFEELEKRGLLPAARGWPVSASHSVTTHRDRSW